VRTKNKIIISKCHKNEERERSIVLLGFIIVNRDKLGKIRRVTIGIVDMTKNEALLEKKI
jgi:hypothetical protein